jgi:hypothetical protein
MKPEQYNRREFEAGRITHEHVDALIEVAIGGHQSLVDVVRAFQAGARLTPDGMLGPRTRAALSASHRVRSHLRTIEEVRALRVAVGSDPIRIAGGWLCGRGVRKIPSHPDWFGGPNGQRDIVHHLTGTSGGVESMARRRTVPYNAEQHGRGKSSWHVTIGRRGEIAQMIAFDSLAYHAGGPNSRPLNGRHPNTDTISIEAVGQLGDEPTPEQVIAMARVAAAIRDAYGTRRENHVLHRDVNTIKPCPGDAWADEYLPLVLEAVYGGDS